MKNLSDNPNNKLYIYNTLISLDKFDDLKFAVLTGSIKYEFEFDDVYELIKSEGYVDDSVTYENWDDFANDSLTIPDLKEILKENNLKVSGRKQELIDRIRENNISLDYFKTDNVKITHKGLDFLKENEYIEFYNKYLFFTDFAEFDAFFKNHEGSIEEISADFLKNQSIKANEKGDVNKLANTAFLNSFIEEFLINKKQE